MKKISITAHEKNIYIYFISILAILIFSILSISSIWGNYGFFMDTLEHIHASWLVSEGKVPYRDFFEHHNPLLWYLFAPFTKLFYRDVNIIYMARLIAILGYFYTLIVLFSISKNYSKSNIGAYLSVIFMFCIPSLFNDIQNFRPDIFMYISVLLAIKNFFKYLDTYKLKYLCISYFLWFIAFLFLQKALFPILGFGLANLWLVYKNKLPKKDIFKASLLPLICFLILLFILYKYDLIYDYFNCNYIFNMILKDEYGVYKTGYNSIFKYFVIFTSLLVLTTYKQSTKGNLLLIIWIILSLASFEFAPHPQYFFLNFIFSSILISPILSHYKKICILAFLPCILYNFTCIHFNNYKRMEQNINLINYVMKNTNVEDKLLNGILSVNLFNHDTDYYWFGFHNIVILADLYTERHFDYNEQIKKHNPKFLFLSDISDKLCFNNTKWLMRRNGALIKKASKGYKNALNKLVLPKLDYWEIDNDYIKKHYKFINKYDKIELWQRIDN